MNAACYAHSKRELPVGDWHRLEDHLRGAATRAAESAAKFGCRELGWYAGLWHDLGKYAGDWQDFLRSAGEDASTLGEETPQDSRKQRRRGPDHSTAGAIHAQEIVTNKLLARALSFAIASHHGGLPDRSDLERRLLDPQKRERYGWTMQPALPEITAAGTQPEFPPWFVSKGTPEEQQRRFEMLVRMLFSALVDGDYLDTERFMESDGERSGGREGWARLSRYEAPLHDALAGIGRRSTAPSHVRNARSDVLRWCLEAGAGKRGVYTLTVPTGGGKTLASLAFALRHAGAHALDRVVIALPFLSILDQTADALREIFGPHFGERALVEHHSTIVPPRDTQRNLLATENWNAPLIVTTQVQLFQSLFARRPRQCRKLHNLANSIIVLDEVQTLPVGLLDPILEVLQELSTSYGATLLLTTATQPALHSRMLGVKRFRGLTPAPSEIVPQGEIERLFATLRRVDVRWPDSKEPVAWSDLAGAIAEERQVLAIVHRRADAAELWNAVHARTAEVMHLSALMCPAHRRVVLAVIRQRLRGGDECRVVSTQLVEAGVDVDFPVVYRAMAGLESLAQSAGRCNREGRLAAGSFRVFRAPTEPVGSLRHHKQIAEVMLAADPELDLCAPSTFRSYFDQLYGERSRDEKNVQTARQLLQFEQTADRFRMIEDDATPVFVPFDSAAEEVIATFRAIGPSAGGFRALQPYGVSVYPDGLRKLQERGAVELLHDSVYVLTSPADYDPILGLRIDREGLELLSV